MRRTLRPLALASCRLAPYADIACILSPVSEYRDCQVTHGKWLFVLILLFRTRTPTHAAFTMFAVTSRICCASPSSLFPLTLDRTRSKHTMQSWQAGARGHRRACHLPGQPLNIASSHRNWYRGQGMLITRAHKPSGSTRAKFRRGAKGDRQGKGISEHRQHVRVISICPPTLTCSSAPHTPERQLAGARRSGVACG